MVDYDPIAGILRCRGDEDRATQGSRRQAFARALRAERDVVVDLSDLTFADSSLMLDLGALARRLRVHGRMLHLRAPQRQVLKLIELVGLSRLPGVALEPGAAALSHAR